MRFLRDSGWREESKSGWIASCDKSHQAFVVQSGQYLLGRLFGSVSWREGDHHPFAMRAAESTGILRRNRLEAFSKIAMPSHVPAIVSPTMLGQKMIEHS
jgi:hypothetical protein